MTENVNDNDYPSAHGGQPVPDAHGQTALLLVESLIHGLIGRSVITVADAIDVVDVAADVKAELGLDMGDTRSSRDRSLMMLESIRGSLEKDA